MEHYGKIKDEAGNELEVYNEGLSGGLIIKDKRTGEARNIRQVFVNNTACKVKERKLGGYYIIPDTEEIDIKLNGAFKFLMVFLAIMTFGMLPLILHFAAFKKYPKKITSQGLVLKSGSIVSWEEIESVVQTLIYGQKQALEFFPKNKSMKRIIVPFPLLKKKELFAFFFYYLKDRYNLKIIDKDTNIYWGHFLKRQ